MRTRRVPFALLWAGVLVPILYFGAQIVRGPFVEGYSFRRNAASDLGAAGVPGAWWFNAIAIAAGVAAIVTSFVWWNALVVWQVGRVGRGLLCVAVASIGVASVSAGAFPLPDERHGGGALGVGLFALPVLLVLVAMRAPVPAWFVRYSVANLLVFALAAAMFSGVVGIDPAANEGLLQRLLAIAVFPPIAVVSGAALRER